MGQAEEDPFAGTEPPGGVDYGKWEFRAKRFVLQRLAEDVLPALPAAAAQPMHACFRVRAGDMLQLAATDMERVIVASTQSVDCAHDENSYWETFIPARKLAAILKEAPDGDVTIAVEKNLAVITAAGGAHWTLKLPGATGYPALLDPALIQFHDYDRQRMLSALKAVRHCVCRDAGRPPLTQVAITDATGMSSAGDHSDMVVTASDGLRFARTPLPGFPLSMSIPASVLDDLLRILNGSSAETVGAGEFIAHPQNPPMLVFSIGATVLAVSSKMYAFPDMDRLLLRPAMENDRELSVDREELAAAVRRVRINADTETSAIALEVSKAGVRVASRDKGENDAHETVPADWAAADQLVCVNHQFLTEMLEAYPDGECKFRLGKSAGKRLPMVLLLHNELVQIIAQMPPELVGYR